MKALLTQSEKEILFKEFEESGKTYAEFSAEKGLNVKTFSKWIYEWHRQNKEIDEVKFVQIKTTAISTPKEIKVQKAGMEIYIPTNLEQNQLKNILSVLAAL